MPTAQTKTLEQLIVREIGGKNGFNLKAQVAFSHVLQHFSDEGYLYKIEHKAIIEKIYIERFYEYHSAEALAREFHLDTKTLLFYRKSYVRLFAKVYLNLPSSTETDLYLLYSALTQNAASAKKQNRSKKGTRSR